GKTLIALGRNGAHEDVIGTIAGFPDIRAHQGAILEKLHALQRDWLISHDCEWAGPYMILPASLKRCSCQSNLLNAWTMGRIPQEIAGAVTSFLIGQHAADLLSTNTMLTGTSRSAAR